MASINQRCLSSALLVSWLVSAVLQFSSESPALAANCVRSSLSGMSTNRVDVGPLLDQADYQVFTQCPGGHVQRRHPAAVDGVDVGALAGQDVHCSLGCVAHAEVERGPSFHLGGAVLLLFTSLKNFLESFIRSFADTLDQRRLTSALTSVPCSQSSRRRRSACSSALALPLWNLEPALWARTLGQPIINECRAVWPRWFLQVGQTGKPIFAVVQEVATINIRACSARLDSPFLQLLICLFCRSLSNTSVDGWTVC